MEGTVPIIKRHTLDTMHSPHSTHPLPPHTHKTFTDTVPHTGQLICTLNDTAITPANYWHIWKLYSNLKQVEEGTILEGGR